VTTHTARTQAKSVRGRPPRTDAEKKERLLQLELYRRAYHAKHGVPLDRIDVALFYVGDDLILRA
jgi:DNA helicase-2/ATP-dependent DNA helicase PcrA